MEPNVRVLPPEELMIPILDLLEEADAVPLVISGSSMTPFLAPGRDTVFLSKVARPLKKGDMILYRRSNGAYVLHRIFAVQNNDYTLVGDNQTELEPGICPEQVLAVVTAVRRKGKLLKQGSFWWDFFEKVWIRVLPFRPAIRKFYSYLKKLF